MSFCILLPNFIAIRRLAAKVMTSYRYSRWRP